MQGQVYVACLPSFLAAALVASSLSIIGQFSRIGHDLHSGVQKFHALPTSRLGSLAIVVGLVVGYISANQGGGELAHWVGALLLASIPVFLGGFLEDLTHKVGESARLLLTLVSASICYFVLGVGVKHTDVPPIDWLLALPGGPFLVTLLLVAGFTHSINIIDGFHGLASGLVMITICTLLGMAWISNDGLIISLCGLTLVATMGFILFNWPWGKIFLGDAGAYLLGFWTVELGLLLVLRNSEISPMAPVVAGILPLTETLFSMYRRKFIRQHPVNHPDGLHLHSLIYRRLLLNPGIDKTHQQFNRANASVVLYLWPPAILFAVLAIVFIYSTLMQLLLMLTFLAAYIWLYKRVVKFKSPHWLVYRVRDKVANAAE